MSRFVRMSKSNLSVIALAASLAMSAGACSRTSEEHAPGSPGPAPAPAPAPSMSSSGTAGSQQDLAKEMDVADKAGTWQDLRHKWQGKQVTWTVTRLAPLCRDASLCNVRPFSTVQGVHYGWMPRLELAPGEFDKLTKGCGASDPCKVTFTGVLSDFQISGDAPTSLKFSDVTIVSAG